MYQSTLLLKEMQSLTPGSWSANLYFQRPILRHLQKKIYLIAKGGYTEGQVGGQRHG